MKFYKSFLFLLILNLLLVTPLLFFLDLRFFILLFVFLSLLNAFLLFFAGFYLRKTFLFSTFPPDDTYGVSLAFEELKKSSGLKNIQLLKTRQLNSAFFCFAYDSRSFVVLSEGILESFSKENIRCLLSYPFQMISSGDLFFLTLLSGFLLLLERVLNFLNYPLSFFNKKKSLKRESLFIAFVLKILSLMTKPIFYKVDKKLLLKSGGREQQALFLWRLDSFMRLNPPGVRPFLAPLFLTNPLTKSSWEHYISLQPLMEARLRSFGVSYPP